MARDALAADATARRRFRAAYAEHRAAEGRGVGGETELLALPYLAAGPRAREWQVRHRSFERFLTAVLAPCAGTVRGRAVTVLDLGAGNGWLCYRLERRGCRTLALDLRCDRVDGLGAAEPYRRHLARLFDRAAASFEDLPLASDRFDIVVFNAALHYAVDLSATLREAARVARPGGRLAILDSPFYRRAAFGEAMVAEKRREARRLFSERADVLTALPFVEYLTPERLRAASAGLGLAWRRHRVRYPLWYELRPLVAFVTRRRPPSRFDVWEATVS